MKSILIIGPIPPPYSGQGTITQFLVDALKPYFNIGVLNISPRGNRIGKSGIFSIKRCFEVLWFSLQLVKYLKKHTIDVVYLTIASSPLGHLRDLILIAISKAFKKRVVVEAHDIRFPELFSKRIWGYSSKQMLKRTEKIIFSSDILLKPAKKYLDKDKLIAIGNSIRKELRLTEEEIERKLSLCGKKREIVILYLNNLIEKKGYLDVLKAAILIKEQNIPSIKFLFAAPFLNAPQEKRILNLIKVYGLEDTVSFLNIRTNKKLLLDGDIFILPTYYDEALSIAMLESINAGMPIITTDVGAARDVVKDGENGFIIKAKSPGMIAEVVKKLDSDRNLLIKMGKKSRELFIEKFDLNIIANQYVNLFNEVLKQKY